MRARIWSEAVVEKSEITCEHNDHAHIPTAHVGNCYRRRNLDIPNKNEKYEAQAITKTVKTRFVRRGMTCFLPTSTRTLVKPNFSRESDEIAGPQVSQNGALTRRNW